MDADDLFADLAYLRKGEGFTSPRLQKLNLIAAVLQQERSEAYERSRSRFVSAIHSLGDPESELLLDVFRLSDRTNDMTTLKERRAVYAASIGRGVETVADKEVPALNRLVTALVTGSYAQSPLAVRVPEMHDGDVPLIGGVSRRRAVSALIMPR